jgi:hypothetical protein
MKDWFMRGFLSGIIGGIPGVVLGYVSYQLHFSKNLFRHFMSNWIYGHYAHSVIERTLSQVWQILWVGILGVGFAMLIRWTGEDYYYPKGAAYGVIIWFVIYLGGALFKIEPMMNQAWQTALTHFVDAVLIGLGTAWVYRLLEGRRISNK